MRALFLISTGGGQWSARARAFVLAARGLRARGHDVLLACASECPVQVRAAAADIPVLALNATSASATGRTLQLRRALKDQSFDVVFVHSDGELLMASSATRLSARGAGRVIKRIAPFETYVEGRSARFARRIAPTSVLFSTQADRARAQLHDVPAFVAPLAVDPTEHARVTESDDALGAPSDATVVVCVHDGEDRRKALIALRAVALLNARHPELHLVVVGGARQEELRMEGAALGINKKVTYLGPRADELSILRAADIGWIAADGDAAAFAALDFMSFGTPMIAERTPLTEHYIADGIAGILLPGAEAMVDMTTIVAMVTMFIAKHDQRAAMGKAAHARLEREFTYDGMIQGFEQAASTSARPAEQTVA